MSIQLQLVFAILVVEMATLTILIAPMPSNWRASLLKAISTSSLLAQAQSFFNILFALVALLFADALIKIGPLTKEHGESPHSHVSNAVHSKLFLHQRNLYLTGSTLFLGLVLNRFFAVVLDLSKQEEKMEALRKQFANSNKEFMRMMDKDKDTEKKIAELEKSLEDAERKAKDAEIILKQAKNQHDAYMSLAERYNELEKKYELRSADEGKKSK
ncbi:B-cell receptor-associated protein 31-like-domain-containing protein [Cladochytrium replicatum]|nr:B-cell receptor-associated protein 31-like-domain-containing protein [Cladochytrium replicatum]